MKIIDAYFPYLSPRFLSTEEMLEVMARHGVEKSVPATADTCPDLTELSRAQVEQSGEIPIHRHASGR